MEKLELVSLNPTRPERVTKIDYQLHETEKKKFINFLRDHVDVYT